MSLAGFVELALFDAECGYYTAQRKRVGRSDGADFYTASSLGPVFARLVTAATVDLLGDADPAAFTFVEIGAEPGRGILADREHPFAGFEAISVGMPITISDRAVVFSNELFDAQPFHRVRMGPDGWLESRVYIEANATVRERFVPPFSEAVVQRLDRLDVNAPEGYTVDLPTGAEVLLARIAEQPWTGAFVAVDYGKSAEELTRAQPEGTSRGYRNHRQVADIFEAPGEQDITHHICWDWLEEQLVADGFSQVTVERQEAFLVKRGAHVVSDILGARPGTFSPEVQTLKELIHPGNMGTKFQVLSALRG